jgi:hypothetical protein
LTLDDMPISLNPLIRRKLKRAVFENNGSKTVAKTNQGIT